MPAAFDFFTSITFCAKELKTAMVMFCDGVCVITLILREPCDGLGNKVIPFEPERQDVF